MSTPSAVAAKPGAAADVVTAVLRLQRTAGNRATAALLRSQSAAGTSQRPLARCGANGCTCGGAYREDQLSAELVSSVAARRRDGAVLLRRAVCPVGVDPLDGIGCYEVPDELPESDFSGPAANDNAIPEAANDNAVRPAEAAEQAENAKGTEGAETVEAAEGGEAAEAAEVAEAAELAEGAELAESAIVTGAAMEEIPVAGWIVGTALIVGGAGYLAYRHFHDAKPPSPPPRVAPVPAPTPARPVMPSGLTQAEQDRWNECVELHDEYKDTQSDYAREAGRYNELRDKLENSRATAQDRVDFCYLLDVLIPILQRLHAGRLRYITRGCDQFDWFSQGTTRAQREAAHNAELDNVDRQLDDLYRLKAKYCR
jgi:hypothetical protein